MEETFEGWRVTALCRPTYSLGHNMRLPEYVETQKHIDPEREHKVLLNMGDEREAFNKIFGEAIEKYNKKQKRADRRITDYYQKILDDERAGKHKNPKATSERKTCYEFQFYIGNRESHCPDKKAEKILRTYITKILPRKFPNFIPINITMHNDEYSFDRKNNRMESPLHFHVVGIFVAHALTPEEAEEEKKYREKCKEIKKKESERKGIIWDEKEWKKKDWRKGMIKRYGKSLEKGMELQTSMSAACNEMGFFTQKGRNTAQQQFEEAVRKDLMDFAEEMGVKINRTKGYSHKHKEKSIYKKEQDNMALEKELVARETLLQARELQLQNRIDDFDYQIQNIEDKELELKKKEEEQQKREENLNKLTADLQFEQNYVKKQKIEYAEKETALNLKEKSLERQKAYLEKQSENQREREKKIQQGEAPYLEREKELLEEKREIFKQNQELNQKRKELQEYDEELKVRDAKVKQKEHEANKKLAEISHEEQNLQDQIKVASPMLIEVKKWEMEFKNNGESIKWAQNEFDRFQKEPNKISFEKLKNSIVNGISGLILHIKNSYETIISGLKEKLYGKKHFYEKNNKYYCEYSYGAEDYKDMFLNTPVDVMRRAIDETKLKGKNTFGELEHLESKSFLERHFPKAKERITEINQKLYKMNNEHSYSM